MTSIESEQFERAHQRDGAAAVIASLLREANATSRSPEGRVHFVMNLLEQMAEHHVATACCLMLSLWPFASELMIHDVCDSIDLWICNNRTPAVIACLKKAVAMETDRGLKRHLDALLQPENGS